MKYGTLLVSVLIIIAVLIPGQNLPDVSIGGYDKLIHMGMFLVWALVAQYDLGTKPLSRLVMLFFAGTVFSAMTEVLQIVVEGRSFDMYDMIADIVGLIIGLMIGGPIIRWFKELVYRSTR
jgi:VanZ family protein